MSPLLEESKLRAAVASLRRTLRIRYGKTVIIDGPFTETKGVLAGFCLIEASSHDEAMAIAARVPPASEGSIEVGPVLPLEP